MKCRFCDSSCIKRGMYNRKQRYRCKSCNRYQQKVYTYSKTEKDESFLVQLNNEGVGIRSISRLMNIPITTVQRLIMKLGKQKKRPFVQEENQSYEIEELRTFVENGDTIRWVIYAINKATGQVIDICVGRRTKVNISKVVSSVLLLNPKRIYTDGLNIYPGLIPKKIHKVFRYNINKIERKNLNLRTHLKRLNRKTICYSKSEMMLENCVKLYFWKQ